jgi:uncharacterized protein
VPIVRGAVQGSTEVPRATVTGELFVLSLGNDRFLVYAPLQLAALIVNRGMIGVLQRFLENPSPGDGPADPAIALFRSLGILDPGPEDLPIRAVSGPPEPTQVTLLLTTACNFRCSYCYAAAPDAEPAYMSLETAARAIRFVIANAVRRSAPLIDVSFHGGGEPTLHWPVLTASADYARRLAAESGRSLALTLATNGYLAEGQIDWVLANLTSASVSFDGLPEIHDANRPSAAGCGTSQRVMRTLRGFDEAGFSYGIRATVLANQIPRLQESVEFIFANFRPRVVQIEPVYRLGRGRSEASAESDAFIAQYRRARARWPSLMFSGAKLDVLANHFCAATADGFCVSAAGNITACTEAFSETSRFADRFFYGRPAVGCDGYDFDPKALEFLRSSGVENRAFCRGCFARWTCAGDCLHKVLDVNDGAELAGAGRCRVIRELTKDLLLERIEQTGGGTWRGLRPSAAPVAGCVPCAGGDSDA